MELKILVTMQELKNKNREAARKIREFYSKEVQTSYKQLSTTILLRDTAKLRSNKELSMESYFLA